MIKTTKIMEIVDVNCVTLLDNPGLEKKFRNIIKKLSENPDETDEIFNFLIEVLRDIRYSTWVAKCFPGILLELLTSAMPLDLNKNDLDLNNHRKNCIILGKLVNEHPDVLKFSLQYFKKYPSPFESLNDQPMPKKKKIVSEINDEDILIWCHNFLKAAPHIFRNKWKWAGFILHMLSSTKEDILWITCQCISILLNYSEAQSHELEKLIVKNEGAIMKNLLQYSYLDSTSYTLSSHRINLNMERDLTKRHIVDISGIQLPIIDSNNIETMHLVPVKSTQDNLRSIALAIASGNAISLVGPVGCGKTALVEYLAGLTGRKKNHFKKVQLGDQTDSRMLLGTYGCTDIPGEFIWQPGVLTQAVQQGYWLLLEDINCAATDVASVLSSLLERNTLSVPGYRDSLPVAPGFQLFVTQRTVHSVCGQIKTSSNALALLQKHLTQINVEPLSRQELITIIETQYPELKTIAPRMMSVFMLFSVGSHQSSLHDFEKTSPLAKQILSEASNVSQNIEIALKSGRLTSTRDLVKWCQRCANDINVSSKDSAIRVLRDAIDIFVGSIPTRVIRLPLAMAIGVFLGIIETETKFYCESYKPNVSLQPLSIHIGRTIIARNEKKLSDMNFKSTKCKFSFTRCSTCLLESITCCVNANEPVLLVGETGTGKTSSIQYLARETGNKLIVINMNQQSDSADLLGGYKPVDLKYVILPIKNDFVQLFGQYFDSNKNAKFLQHISNCFFSSDWKSLLTLMVQSQKAAVQRLKNNSSSKAMLLKKWLELGTKLSKLEIQIKSQTSLAFSFIEGSLVKALQKGYWVLLDEINLASSETLECLSMLLEGKHGSINLLERGDETAIPRHVNFTLFACMNPATDVGKRDLPAGLRNRFTEFYVEELTDKQDLLLLIKDYLSDMSVSQSIVENIYKFYTNIKKEAKIHLMDGTGQSPHYSLRTLCRALSAAPLANCGTVTRSLYETMCMSFLTQLDSVSHPKVLEMIASATLGKKSLKSVLNQPIPEPKSDSQKFIQFEGYWVCQGQLEPNIPSNYVLTPTVRKNLRDLVRIISLGKLPILLQGDTSVGKTSLITYIAKASGNHCVRINNHQHTDLQEYIGSYATDANGKLIFKEGILVEAMRKGHWIILDELNLAPSDVLEALNRVLDDNRELFIPETQQVVTANQNFMLFATQNPPGLYGGRKLLSRAFKNRFVELHFDEIPKPELETILYMRCEMPQSYCRKIVAVMSELQARRKGSAAVQGKEGFITLRDLFRWGQRYKCANANQDTLHAIKFYDWDQHIADEGYLVLAGRVRKCEERKIIQEVIEKHMKRSVDPENLFSLSETTSSVTKDILIKLLNSNISNHNHIVWTFNMRRLAVLIAKSFAFNEPVLLVGETGCGKTTVCQILSELRNCQLLSVNCHMHTESSDFLGGLRPVRQHKNDGQLFEWVDGPLVNALRSGDMFLADEISLADDSVLERLNSLLEPERELLIAEKTLDIESDNACVITAKEGFQFISTMNPGGDYGKKELSPALRNRFTEIWCDHVTSKDDLLAILEKSVLPNVKFEDSEIDSGIGRNILDFVDWLKQTKIGERFTYSIRDLLTWVNFINAVITDNKINIFEAYIHGACMTFLDCLGTGNIGSDDFQSLENIRESAIKKLLSQIPKTYDVKNMSESFLNKEFKMTAKIQDNKFGITPFFISKGPNPSRQLENFNFTSPTTGLNTMRLLRGLQLKKPILLEGSPGVGKTSLVTALAKISSHKILRINLSDQTDISDLFGADLPTTEGTFAWQEGAFLTALQTGTWILLDELNLAPQPVLEGLNACLDHRSEIYIPELDRTFKVNPDTKIFACQNPLRQGGARRGLPQSFLNRFTQVYIETLSSEDLLFITSSLYDKIPYSILQNMIVMNERILKETTELMLWGYKGSPWELNLRDIQRWCDGIMSVYDENDKNTFNPGNFAKLIYIDRMRTQYDKGQIKRIYSELFYSDYSLDTENPLFYITENMIHVGDVKIQRTVSNFFPENGICLKSDLLVLRDQLPILKSLIQCINMNWLSILIGPTATGKSSCVEVLAHLTGNILKILPVTSAMDTTDVLGGFEQTDFNRHLENLYVKLQSILIKTLKMLMSKNEKQKMFKILYQWETFQNVDQDYTVKKIHTMKDETEIFFNKHQQLQNLVNNLIDFNEEDNCIKDCLLKIDEKLKRLHTLVTEEGSINAGGKFEWVDSLLVKCLLEGYWLLIDNVNLCSSAVLDRLNGLLEPNGYLSIPERGGNADEIHPHPNFRMFFAMDPKNGEISRAMRNRGVEIFVIGNEGIGDYNLSENLSSLDISAMMASKGLENSYHNLFMKLHDKLSSFIQGNDKPTLCYLLQAAFLTSQQILRGEISSEAIKNSFSDIYIKSRNGSDFIGSDKTLSENKNDMLQILNDIIKEELNKDLKKCWDTFSRHHTLISSDLKLNSSLGIVSQDAYGLSQATFNLMKSLLPENITKVFFLHYNYYVQSSQNDLKLRYNVAQKIINTVLSDVPYCEIKQEMDSLNNNLMEVFSSIQSSKSDYPIDKNLLNIMKIKDFENGDHINKLSIFSYYITIISIQHIMTEMKIKKNAETSYGYSEMLINEKISDLTNIPIVKNWNSVINETDNLVVNILKSTKTIISSTVWIELILLLLWRNRFYKICNDFVILNHMEDQNKVLLQEEMITDVQIHYKWLTKYLLKKLKQLAKVSQIDHKNLSKLLFIINRSLQSQNSPLRSISKHLKTNLGQPSPFANIITYNNYISKENLLIKSSVLPIENRGKLTKDSLICFFDQTFLKSYLNFENIWDVQSTIDVENLVKELDTNQKKHAQFSIEEQNKIKTEIQLWPLKEFLVSKIINLIKIKLFEWIGMKCRDENKFYISQDLGKLFQYLSVAIKSVPTIPSKIRNLVLETQQIFEEKFFSENYTIVFENSAEIMDNLTKYLEYSPLTNPSNWINFDIKNLEQSNSDYSFETTSMYTLATNLPHLTLNTVEVVMHKSIQEAENPELPTALFGYKERSVQLYNLHQILYENMVVSNISRFNQSFSDAKMLLINYKHFITSLNLSLNRKTSHYKIETDKNIQNLTMDCIDKIDKYFKEILVNNPEEYLSNVVDLKTHICNSLNTGVQIACTIKDKLDLYTVNDDDLQFQIGQSWTLLAFCQVGLFSEIGFMDPIRKEYLKNIYIKEDNQFIESILNASILHDTIKGTVRPSNSEVNGILINNLCEPIFNCEESENLEISNKDGCYEKFSHLHPHYDQLIHSRKFISEKINKQSEGFYRPPELSYLSVFKELRHFSNSLASSEILSKHYNQLTRIYKKLSEVISLQSDLNMNDIKIANDIIRECSLWQYSVQNFYFKIRETYSNAYPDIVKPFLNGVTQLLYGFTLMKNSIVKAVRQLTANNLNEFMENLIRYPIINEKFLNNTHVADFLMSKDFIDFIKGNMKNMCDDTILEREPYRLLIISLKEIYCGCSITGRFDEKLWEKFCQILTEVVLTWQKQESAIEKKKQEEDSLYVTKTKCEDLTEDEQDELEKIELFPSYGDIDFIDFKTSLLEQHKTIPITKNDDKFLLSKEDLIEIATLHCQLVKNLSSAEWLSTNHKKLQNNFLDLLIERYETFHYLIGNVIQGLNENIDSKLLPSLMVLVAHARGAVDGEDYFDSIIEKNKKQPNFYHDSWPNEVRQCLHILEETKSATIDLLREWPDFPILKDVLIVVNRILNFPVTSPVIRFLTGIELLRDKVEEWNKLAHKNNNMNSIALNLSQQIVSWRKLELNSWRNCLSNTYENSQNEACKYWFHLFVLIDCYINEKPLTAEKIKLSVETSSENIMNSSQFIIAMQGFIEKSSIGEFSKRMDILYSFHCHVTNFKFSTKRDEVLSILWNLHTYYSQFSNQIDTAVKDKRKPIEKKLRDFVKICSWERDLSYWAVKDIVDKAHKTLQKHIKEFKTALQDKVTNYFHVQNNENVNKSIGIWDKPKRNAEVIYDFTIEPTHHLVSVNLIKKFLDQSSNPDVLQHGLVAASSLTRMSSLINKARGLCEDVITNSQYPELLQSLDSFVGTVIETSSRLRNLEVSQGLPKEKQKKQVKGFLQLKKKALADLFKIMTKLGISHRKGLVENDIRNSNIVNFTGIPIDLKASLSYLKNKTCDSTLLSYWEGCETYYQKCIAHVGTLMISLLSPHADLDSQYTVRFKGLSVHLMLMIQDQKSQLAKSSRVFCTLRSQVSQLSALCESESNEYYQSIYDTKLNTLVDLFSIIILAMEQFKIVLKAFPQKSSSEISIEQPKFDTALSDNKMLKCYKSDSCWNDINSRVTNIINVSTNHINDLKKVKTVLPNICLNKYVSEGSLKNTLCQKNIDSINLAFLKVTEIQNEIQFMKNLYEIEEHEEFGKIQNPLVLSLNILDNKISQDIEQIQSIESKDNSNNTENNPHLNEFNIKIEDLVNHVLFSIQEIYKKHVALKSEDKVSEEAEDEDNIKDNHLTKELQESLSSNVKEFHLRRTITKLNTLISDYIITGEQGIPLNSYKQSLSKCIPLLEQLTLLVQFYITQQVATHRLSCKMLSIISGIFKELSTKGFCIPSGLELESGEGEGQKFTAGGMGLGDGEGEKDVSERIENQDQLEDAHKAGEEKEKQDDKDCKEEEHGVDMTDDFESHLQDVDKKDDSDDQSDDENADKQMGDTEMGADKLDQQIWGSDEEEEEDNNEQKNEENEKGSGKPMNDKKFGAKENNDEPDEGSNFDEENEKEKKDINEMEEPEYDDDHVDPYHGKQKPLPEPEPMELPDDMNLENNDMEDEEEEDGENQTDPFEINKFDDKEEGDDKEKDEKTDKHQKDTENKNTMENDNLSDMDEDEENKNDDTSMDQPNEEDEPAEVDDSLDNKQDNEDKTEEQLPEDLNDDKEAPKIPDESHKDNINESEEKTPEEDNQDSAKDDAKPSRDNPTAEDNVDSSQMNDGSKDMVETNPSLDKEEQNAPYEQSQEQEGDEKDGTGQSELSENQVGHQSNKNNMPKNNAKNEKKSENRKSDKRNKPGTTEEERALGEVKEPVQKKMKILNIQDMNKKKDEEENEDGAGENNDETEADMFQHIKKAKEKDLQAIDAATKEQAESQPVPNQPEEEGNKDNLEDDILMDDTDDPKIDDVPDDTLEAEKVGEDKKHNDKDKISKKGDKKTDNISEEAGMEIEGENVQTMAVQRGSETSFHTKMEHLQTPLLLTESQHNIYKRDEIVLTKSVNSENTIHWHNIWSQTSEKARMLTEKLRLVLEPTGISRLAGDYRTGRRINMRRVIPYIASNFRKDRIWLRRTKPAKREYQIAIAIDDSSSMNDNKSKEMAFESLALVSQALNLLEAGELAVLSFGESTKVLHSFSEQFTESSGSKLLENLTFKQTKTKIAQLLDYSLAMFEEESKSTNALNAKLLLIVSDGRGIFFEGTERVSQAVRRARQKGIFMVYLIVDNPENKQSILDIRTPVFDQEKKNLLSMTSYLDVFPFPFYLILRDIVALPTVLSDALRQWFELAANSDKL